MEEKRIKEIKKGLVELEVYCKKYDAQNPYHKKWMHKIQEIHGMLDNLMEREKEKK